MASILVLLVLGALVAFLLVPSKRGKPAKRGGGARAKAATGSAKVVKLPAGKVPVVALAMVSANGKPLRATEAARAVRAFYRGIGWFSDREDMACELEDFQAALADHEMNLDGNIYGADQELSALEFDRDDSELDPNRRNVIEQRISELERLRDDAQAKLAAFRGSHGAFVAAYLNHRVHGAPTPVEPDLRLGN